jgi:hypothetical protein
MIFSYPLLGCRFYTALTTGNFDYGRMAGVTSQQGMLSSMVPDPAFRHDT